MTAPCSTYISHIVDYRSHYVTNLCKSAIFFPGKKTELIFIQLPLILTFESSLLSFEICKKYIYFKMQSEKVSIILSGEMLR